jgi:hypothetical protein
LPSPERAFILDRRVGASFNAVEKVEANMRIHTAALVGIGFLASLPGGNLRATGADQQFDVVVYGGTSAGVTAAVQVARMGKTVAIVCPDEHLGGLSSGGLGWTDTGNKAVIGGLAREFYQRIWQHYERPQAWKWQTREAYGNRGQGTPAIDGDLRTMWIFEPSTAERVFEDLVAEHQIPVHRGEYLDRAKGVERDGSRINRITMLSGKQYTAWGFIDATYEGDLMAAAGVRYHVGRESNDVYGERWNGVQKDARHHGHYFAKPVDPYMRPGDPGSGLLPRISPDPAGENGQGDHRIQAYCFRMCLTQVPENRLPFPKPEGYDPAQYELLLRVFDTGWRETFRKFDPIPNAKTDTNNHGPFSTDNIGRNYDYPEGSYERRREIIREHEFYQKGLMYFLANDPRVPEDVRSEMSRWGLARDEFTDNGNWPHQIYVREARRMIGEYVMTEQDCLAMRATPKSVGMGSYAMDSHNVQRYVTPQGTVQNEGDIGVRPFGPYCISYDALVPKKEECTNLLVPVCVSSSHIAFGSIRMEPVFMILGQSAATASVMAMDQRIAVQDLDYAALRERLLADGQVLEYTGPRRSGAGLDPKSLQGVVADDSQAKLEGHWQKSGSIGGYVGFSYLHDNNENKGACTVSFQLQVPRSGEYDLRLAYTSSGNRASNVPVVIERAGHATQVTVDQRAEPPIGGTWISLGALQCGASEAIVVTVSNTDTDGYVVADAVQLLPADADEDEVDGED